MSGNGDLFERFWHYHDVCRHIVVSIFSFRTERIRAALPELKKLNCLMYLTGCAALAGLAMLLITGAVLANEFEGVIGDGTLKRRERLWPGSHTAFFYTPRSDTAGATGVLHILLSLRFFL